MFASVRRYRMDPLGVDELITRVEQEFVPIVSKSPGFVAYYAVDAGNGIVTSISIFEDQKGAEQSSLAAADWVGRRIASLLPTPPEITAGEVRVAKTR